MKSRERVTKPRVASAEPDGGDGLRREAFAASREAHAFGGGRLDAHAACVDAENLRDARAHGIAMRSDLRALANQRHVAMHDVSAFLVHQRGCVVEKFP